MVEKKQEVKAYVEEKLLGKSNTEYMESEERAFDSISLGGETTKRLEPKSLILRE